MEWTWGTGATSTSGTGPTSANSGRGYVYLEGNDGQDAYVAR